MHCSASISSSSRAIGLAAAVLLTGCFNPEPPELTTGVGSTSDGSTSAPPLETSTGPGETTTTVDGTSTTASTLDDTTTTSTPDDTTTTDTTTGDAVCGNGVIEADEDCDDMGESATCDADCTPAECGDTVTNATALETCDDGNTDDTDDCPACQPASCGDGFLWAGIETCDDGNAIDTDICTNECTIESVRVAGNATTYLVNALTALGEPYTLDGSEWPAVASAGVLIIGHDGASVTAPDYQLHLDAGGHVLLVGGSGDPAYAAWASAFIANTGEGNWHQSSGCASDWNTSGAHPMTALLPGAYEFGDQSISYHMLHFTAAGQPADTELLGQSCEAGPNNYVLATRRYPSGGTFTYMALDLGPYGDATSGPSFVQPFMQGYLGYVRSPAP